MSLGNATDRSHRKKSRVGACLLLLALSLAFGCGTRDSEDNGDRSKGHHLLTVSFDRLAGFPVPEPGDGAAFQVPDEIRALSGRRVIVTGYLVPVDDGESGSSRFLLLRRSPSDLEDRMPRVNEWIDVTVSGGRRVRCFPGETVRVRGHLLVHEEMDGGSLIGLYYLEADEVVQEVES